jgi:hypothetical protein
MRLGGIGAGRVFRLVVARRPSSNVRWERSLGSHFRTGWGPAKTRRLRVVSNSSVKLARQEAADVEITLLACHLAAPTLAVPDERRAILVRHVEHGLVGNVDPLALKHDLVVVVARLNDCLGRPAVKVRAATASLLTRQAIEPDAHVTIGVPALQIRLLLGCSDPAGLGNRRPQDNQHQENNPHRFPLSQCISAALEANTQGHYSTTVFLLRVDGRTLRLVFGGAVCKMRLREP